MNGHRHHTISLLLLLAFTVTHAVSAATISCDNNTPKESDKVNASDWIQFQPGDYANLEITCSASVDAGEASSLEVILGGNGKSAASFPCDEQPHALTDIPSQAWSLFPRALMLPGAVVSGWFKVGRTNSAESTTHNFTVTDSRTVTRTTVDYQPTVTLKGFISQKLTAPLINGISGNGTVTLTPGTTDTASYGTLVNGSEKLEYNLSNQPAWNNGVWTLAASKQYDMQIEDTNVPVGEYTGIATLTATCE